MIHRVLHLHRSKRRRRRTAFQTLQRPAKFISPVPKLLQIDGTLDTVDVKAVDTVGQLLVDLVDLFLDLVLCCHARMILNPRGCDQSEYRL